jgi:hypothetical protein
LVSESAWGKDKRWTDASLCKSWIAEREVKKFGVIWRLVEELDRFCKWVGEGVNLARNFVVTLAFSSHSTLPFSQ